MNHILKTTLFLFLLIVSQQCFSQSDLIASYPFSGNANDESTNANNGTVYGATLTTDRFDQANSAYAFDGVDDYILLDTSLQDCSKLSISFWVYYTGTQQGKIICDADDVPNNDFFIDVTTNGIGLKADKGSATLNYAKGNAVTGLNLLNDWYHVVVLLTEDSAMVYLNAEHIKTIVEKASITGYHNGHACIGAFDDGTPLEAYFKGKIDDINIYNYCIDQEKIDSLYHYQPNCLIAHYPFTGNANDAVGSNHGTVIGASLSDDMAGHANCAYEFDGVDDYIKLDTYLEDLTYLTVTSWIYFTGDSQGKIYCDADHTPNKDFYLDVKPDGIGLKADKTNGTLNHSKGLAVTGLNLMNSWNHLAAVVTPQYSEIYLNGVKIMTIVETGSNVGYHYGHAVIGAFDDGAQVAAYFKGKIDEVRVYNCALDSQSIYNQYINEYVSLNEEFSNSYFKLYPNPAKDIVNIFSASNNDYTLYLYDIHGKLILTKWRPSMIELNALSEGIYYVKIMNERAETLYNQKLLILK
jgi:hypothetical protein